MKPAPKPEELAKRGTPDLVSGWHPMSDPVDLKHMGKLLEELGEAVAAGARCLIQCIDQCEPVTGKPNKEWLEEELSDVITNINLVCHRFGLDKERMMARGGIKTRKLQLWHSMA
jgi:NTP pyrophosphatase (non-canonical NTP hydrolase)